MTDATAPLAHTVSHFEATLQRATSKADDAWGFVVLPREVSATLPRRGRTTVDARINGKPVRATLEPDGQLSHWLRVHEPLRIDLGAAFGDLLGIEISPVDREPEPVLPPDFAEALASLPEALATWHDTTTLARVDWIHWIETAKQAKTRAKRISDACRQLAQGKRRVCCFDPSGFYSKALCAPQPME